MKEKILLVDDERTILAAYSRLLRNKYLLETAPDGPTAIERLRSDPSFAVVLCDLQMPHMSGADLLATASRMAPETVRVLFTGRIEPAEIVDAVNNAGVFRVVSKPCPFPVMEAVLDAAVARHHELLEQRHGGGPSACELVDLLTELLRRANPAVAARSTRLKKYVAHMTASLRIDNAAPFELAAALSQVGCLGLEPSDAERCFARQPVSEDVRRRFDEHPIHGAAILARVKALGEVAAMIAAQRDPVPADRFTRALDPPAALGGHLIAVALEFDHLLSSGHNRAEALAVLECGAERFAERLVAALHGIVGVESPWQVQQLPLRDLAPAMVLDAPVLTSSSVTVAPAGVTVSPGLIQLLLGYGRTVGIVEPLAVRVRVVETEA